MSDTNLQLHEHYTQEDVRVIKNLIDPSGKLVEEQIQLF